MDKKKTIFICKEVFKNEDEQKRKEEFNKLFCDIILKSEQISN